MDYSNKIIVILILFWLSGCATRTNYQIDFCLNFGTDDQCYYEKEVFPKHQRIYVKFSADKPLTDSLYIGNISILKPNGIAESLGFKEFRPESDTATYLKHYIPFDVFGGSGGYLVEFKNSREEVLAKREVHFETN